MLRGFNFGVKCMRNVPRRCTMDSSSRAASSCGIAAHTPEETEDKFIVKTYNTDGVRTQKGLLFTHGKGAYLYASNGKKYLDFCAGIAVSGLGHADPEWSNAIADQAQVTCFLFKIAFVMQYY